MTVARESVKVDLDFRSTFSSGVVICECYHVTDASSFAISSRDNFTDPTVDELCTMIRAKTLRS